MPKKKHERGVFRVSFYAYFTFFKALRKLRFIFFYAARKA